VHGDVVHAQTGVVAGVVDVGVPASTPAAARRGRAITAAVTQVRERHAKLLAQPAVDDEVDGRLTSYEVTAYAGLCLPEVRILLKRLKE